MPPIDPVVAELRKIRESLERLLTSALTINEIRAIENHWQQRYETTIQLMSLDEPVTDHEFVGPENYSFCYHPNAPDPTGRTIRPYWCGRPPAAHRKESMPTTLNRRAFRQLVQEDLAWLRKQPHALERDHIETLLEMAEAKYYDRAEPPPHSDGRDGRCQCDITQICQYCRDEKTEFSDTLRRSGIDRQPTAADLSYHQTTCPKHPSQPESSRACNCHMAGGRK